MTPASGKIVGVNELLQEKPGTINKSPEGEGWIAKIEVTDSEELKDLMDGDAYGRFVAE
jgi:glycine cleavage system H protein